MRVVFRIFPVILICLSCHQENHTSIAKSKTALAQKDSIKEEKLTRDSSEYEKLFVRNGLVNITEFDPDIRVVLLYNTDKNFLGKSFYKGLNQCYLPCNVATKLNHAQKFLKQEHPFYNLIVFDATRPAHIQKLMWIH